MKFLTINFFLFLSSISKIFSHLKCANTLAAQVTDSCLIKDINNDITYVSKCKKGKICISSEELKNTRSITKNNLFLNEISKLNLGQCVPFIMPLFVGDSCAVNEECASKNCDGGKCEVPKDFCYNHLQCDYGEYCELKKNENEDGDHKCHKFKKEGQNCFEDAECGRFMICDYNEKILRNVCQKIGSVSIGSLVNNEMSCKTGYINKNKNSLYCKEITENEVCKLDPSTSTYSAKIKLDDEDSESEPCSKNDLDGFYYTENSRNKIEAFYDYKSKLDELYDEMEDDEIMWNWNDNRYHGDNKELKTKYFFYKHPFYYGKYQKDDDEMDCVIDFLKQRELNGKNNKISKFILMMFMLFLI